jgi:hypothetical protein
LDVVTDRAEWQICQCTQLIQGESGVHVLIIQYNCQITTVR